MKTIIKILGCLIITLFITLSIGVHPGGADEKHEKGAHPAEGAAGTGKVKLDLGGKFCDFYPKEITDALMKLPGVKSVDAVKKQKFVTVEYEKGKVTLDQMVAAVGGVKGDGWNCAASVSHSH